MSSSHSTHITCHLIVTAVIHMCPQGRKRVCVAMRNNTETLNHRYDCKLKLSLMLSCECKLVLVSSLMKLVIQNMLNLLDINIYCI